jgi:hypothetical protein
MRSSSSCFRFNGSIRPDPFRDLRTTLVLCQLQFVVCLELQPELRSRAKVARQTEGRVRGDRPSAANDIVHPSGGHEQLRRQPIRGQPKWAEEVLSQCPAWMNWRHRFGLPHQLTLNDRQGMALPHSKSSIALPGPWPGTRGCAGARSGPDPPPGQNRWPFPRRETPPNRPLCASDPDRESPPRKSA